MWGRRKNQEISDLRTELAATRSKLREAWASVDRADAEVLTLKSQLKNQQDKTAQALQSAKDEQDRANSGNKVLQDKMYGFEKEQKVLLAWLLDFAPSEILSDPAQSGTVYALALNTLKAWLPEKVKPVVEDDTTEEDSPSMRRTPAPRGRK